jgi:hypothetical protein
VHEPRKAVPVNGVMLTAAVIPSEGAKRRSRGIAIVLAEGPLYRDDCDSSPDGSE